MRRELPRRRNWRGGNRGTNDQERFTRSNEPKGLTNGRFERGGIIGQPLPLILEPLIVLAQPRDRDLELGLLDAVPDGRQVPVVSDD